jgi:hypothetical protein
MRVWRSRWSAVLRSDGVRATHSQLQSRATRRNKPLVEAGLTEVIGIELLHAYLVQFYEPFVYLRESFRGQRCKGKTKKGR